MFQLWIATALLAASWMMGLDYFQPANPYAWLAMVAVAVALLARGFADSRVGENATVPFEAAKPLADWPWNAIAIGLMLPAAWFAAWPYRAAPLLVVLGLAASLPLARRRWLDRLAVGAAAAGVILFVQALALEVYAAHTARSHDLPWPLPDVLAGVASLLGMDAAADGGGIAIYSMRQTHRLAATWELLLDPATLLFFTGGLAMLAMRIGSCRFNRSEISQPGNNDSHPERSEGSSRHPEILRCFQDDGCGAWRAWISGLRALTLVVIAWLPLRAGLLMALYLHRVLRSDPDRPLHAMNHFFSPWILLGLLIVPVLLAWRFVCVEKWGRGARDGGRGTDAVAGAKPQAAHPKSKIQNQPISNPQSLIPNPSSIPRPPSPIPFLLVALAVALFTAAVYWCPSGSRKSGRVMVVERHSEWEPTTKPYDTEWFVEPEPFPDVNSGYNYARIYRYLGQYFEMSRLLENEKIDDESLAKCDVLIVKTPTIRYTRKEAEAVVQFVERGGGLLLVGDHTNYERSSTIMNDIARPMGFIFRDDLLFSFGENPYEQFYEPPAVPHPIVQYVPPMDFAVSCSVDPGSSNGRAAVANTGLWSMGPEYHNDNFHPVPQHCPAMRYGAFIQTWAAAHGKGRVVAFTDSTIFSNFCVGQPGKSEIMLGMVEWLNRAEPWLNPRPWLIVLGLLSIGAAVVWVVRRGFGLGESGAWLALLAAGACAWAFTSVTIAAVHRWNIPEPERLRPERRVVIDRETSTAPLSKGPYTEGGGSGYGLLEQWIARMDCHTVRRSGDDLFSGDVLAVICPSRSVSDEYRRKVEEYVAGGGHLLVIDSPENINSTANGVLWPFGISIHHDRAWKGRLTTALNLPAVELDSACEVVGGKPAARIGQLPVAAVARHGRGTVLAVGFGSLWNDSRMGETWMLEPDATVKARYRVLFGMLQAFFDGKPWPDFPAQPTEKSRDALKDLPLKEQGPAEL